MVGLSVVSENLLNIMPRTKTNANLKTSTPRRSSLQPRSPYFWNAPYGGQDTPRKNSTGKPGTARLPYRRKSTGESYKVYELGENGIKNIQLIEVSETDGGKAQQTNHIFPPITSLRNPRLLSATPRSDKRKTKRTSTTVGGFRHSSHHSKSNKSIPNSSHKFLQSERSNTEHFCHGLPSAREAKNDQSDSYIEPNEPMTSRTTMSSMLRSKLENNEPTLSNRGAKPRASSLRSQPSSSDGSITSAAFRARMASRRFSLPVTPSAPQSLLARKSKESSKVMELSSRSHLSTGDKKSQKTTSLLTSSDKFSSPPSSTAARDTVPMTTHGDGLHIIEETPAEPGTPLVPTQCGRTFTTREDTNIADKEQDTASNKTSRLSNALSINFASEDYINVLTSLTLSEQNQAPKSEDIPNIAVTASVPSLKDDAASKEVDQPDINNNNDVITEETLDTAFLPTQKAELITSSSMFGDDEWLIDATILNERDEDLCDADFREKRIIQWIIAAETGRNVDQQVESAISPSPTNGSRETAITVIYGE